jgi:hypothetical protein
MVDGLRVLFRGHGELLFPGGETMSGEEDLGSLRLTVSIYYPGGVIPNGDLARRLAGLEWWISTREELPPGKLKVIDLTQLKD